MWINRTENFDNQFRSRMGCTSSAEARSDHADHRKRALDVFRKGSLSPTSFEKETTASRMNSARKTPIVWDLMQKNGRADSWTDQVGISRSTSPAPSWSSCIRRESVELRETFGDRRLHTTATIRTPHGMIPSWHQRSSRAREATKSSLQLRTLSPPISPRSNSIHSKQSELREITVRRFSPRPKSSLNHSPYQTSCSQTERVRRKSSLSGLSRSSSVISASSLKCVSGECHAGINRAKSFS